MLSEGKTFYLSVVDPERTLFEGKATFVSAPGEVGFFEVLVNHAPFIASLKEGLLKVRDENNQEFTWPIKDGFFEISHNSANLIITQTVLVKDDSRPKNLSRLLP